MNYVCVHQNFLTQHNFHVHEVLALISSIVRLLLVSNEIYMLRRSSWKRSMLCSSCGSSQNSYVSVLNVASVHSRTVFSILNITVGRMNSRYGMSNDSFCVFAIFYYCVSNNKLIACQSQMVRIVRIWDGVCGGWPALLNCGFAYGFVFRIISLKQITHISECKDSCEIICSMKICTKSLDVIEHNCPGANGIKYQNDKMTKTQAKWQKYE